MADQSSTHTSGDPITTDGVRVDSEDSATHVPLNKGLNSSDGNNPAPSSSYGGSPVLPSSPNNDRQETVISKRPPAAAAIPPRPSSPLEMGVALEGQMLGHFQLGKFVGGGGMGAVFCATDTMLDRTVAVKVLSRDHSDHDILRRFKNEAQSAARLDHDNIARVHYVGEDRGWNYIVFEFIDGLNIRDLVFRNGPLPLEDAINYTIQVAEALEHAFQRDVVHRDIKPSNVLITPDGHIKLVDMGLARLHQVESPDNDLTASGVTLGTFDYISPEQARDPRSADVRSDIYSLGCSFYFMLTGRPPFPEGTVLQKLLSHTSDERPDARLYRPELPEEVTEILNRMLAKNPQERFQQPSELVGELLLMADQFGLQSTSHGGTVWITPSREQPGWMERVIPIVVSVVGLVLSIWLLDRFLPSGRNSGKLPVDQNGGAKIVAREDNNAGPKHGIQKDDKNNTSNERINNSGESGDNQTEPSDSTQTIPDNPPEANDVGNESSSTGVVESSSSPIAEFVGRFDELGDVSLPSTEGKIALNSEELGSGLSLSSETSPPYGLNSADAINKVSEPTIGIAELSVRTLIVGPAVSGMPVDSLPVDSLEAACRIATDLPEVDTIEIWSNGPLLVEPFELRSATLTIRAGDGYAPELIFRNSKRDFSSDGRMLRLVGGSLLFENIHFRVELPREVSDGWALFSLDRVERLDLDDCTMTIVNASESGLTRQERVSFFEIQEPPKAEMMTDGNKMPVDPPAITLNRCIARGQATLVVAKRVTPFTLDWTQGLFISTQRLVETGGAIMEPELDGKVKINLSHVTVAAEQGLCLLEAKVDAPYQLFLLITCNNCLLDSATALPLIEHRGARGEMEENQRMKFIANSCWFQNKCLLWQILPLEGSNFITVVRDRELRNKMMNSSTPWFDEHLTETIKSTTFRNLPAEGQGVHTHTTADYVLGEHLTKSDTDVAGFDPELLPALPLLVNETNGTGTTTDSSDDG